MAEHIIRKLVMPFAELGLSEPLLRAVAEEGYTVPTPIQAKAIPAVLAGGDILAGAQTGTGKTAGFVLPMLHRLSASASPYTRVRKPLRALILTPTRELAAQVEASIKTYGRHLKITSMALFGGVALGPQTVRLKRGVDILVATPGRLLDHQRQRNVDFSSVEIFVLDEADRMLDMGFIPDVKRVLALLPAKRQNLLFSATFSDEIKELADRLLDRPQTIEVAPRNATVDAIAQRVHPVDRARKGEMLAWLIRKHGWEQVLVFTRTKHGADKLVTSLECAGIRAVGLHGNKSQGARTRALSDFKAGSVKALVATDIAARGIDIDQLPHVVNYDLPNVPEDYVHRIGRTGRAGASGEAVSLVCVDEHVFLRDIERLIKRPIPREVIPGFEPDPSVRAESVFAKRGRGQGQRASPAQARNGGQGQSRDSRRSDASPKQGRQTSESGNFAGTSAGQARNRTDAAGQGNAAGPWGQAERGVTGQARRGSGDNGGKPYAGKSGGQGQGAARKGAGGSSSRDGNGRTASGRGNAPAGNRSSRNTTRSY